jgi:hypothetical protein
MLLVYWTLLHEECLVTYRELGGDIAVAHTYIVHSVPALAILINFLLTDVVIKTSHYKVLVWIALVFGFANYVATLKNKEPIYWFLTWEDWKSPAFIVALATVVSVMFVILGKVSWIIKRGNSNYSEERDSTRSPRKLSPDYQPVASRTRSQSPDSKMKAE